MSIILFDVDGVLIRNPAIAEYVTDKSVRYLQKHARVPVRYRTYKNMQKLNRLAYTTLGHTSFVVDDTRNGVWVYNDYVFDRDTLEFVRHAVNDTDRRRIRDIANVLMLMSPRTRVGLCTNTPMDYCTALFEGLSFDPDKLFNVCFTSDTGFLKPTENFYEHVEHELGNCGIHFMDDSARNVNAVRDRSNWLPQHVPESDDLFAALRNL